MSEKETGGWAFASNAVCAEGQVLQEGMTLRDYFAANALQGLVGSGHSREAGTIGIKECAELSYQFADAMLEARKS